jgi:hypothetical protein
MKELILLSKSFGFFRCQLLVLISSIMQQTVAYLQLFAVFLAFHIMQLPRIGERGKNGENV